MFTILYKGTDHILLRIAGSVHKVKLTDLIRFNKEIREVIQLPNGPREITIKLPTNPPIKIPRR